MFARILAIAILIASALPLAAQEFGGFQSMAPPVGPDAREPYLHVTKDGRLLMSWTEISEKGPAVMMAAFDDGLWSAPRAIRTSRDLFINWADFPSLASFGDGTLIAHWLETTGQSSYDYDVRIALSRDEGASWTAPIVPHLDGTRAQHGFVTLMPFGKDIVAVWLDGRAYDGELVEEGAVGGQMQLRSAVLSSDGVATPDVVLDVSTCSCCQTDAAVAGASLLVVYRDRTADEIRDISIVGLRNGEWSAPRRVHADNWEIPGCPVNGPSISARDRNVVVAWFTGAGNVPAVKVALSDDRGANFETVVRVDRGEPVGRVDTLMLEDGTALLSWVEWTGADEQLLICVVTVGGCERTVEVATNRESGSINFPRMAATPEALYIAWTQPLAGGGDTVRLLRALR